jgi:hypothetical protein
VGTLENYADDIQRVADDMALLLRRIDEAGSDPTS